MSLDLIRAAIETAPDLDAATFARRTRNAIAQAVLAAALAEQQATPPTHEPPVDELRAHVGPELAEELLALYAGGDDWTRHAIDALEPLHALTRH